MLSQEFTRTLFSAVVLPFFATTVAYTGDTPNPQNTPAKKNQAIPWNQIGAKAGADYHGDGLSVAATATGARLHCMFQRLDGEATGEGLWLVSTVTNQPNDRFRVVATAVGRQSLPPQGAVTVDGQTVRFTRAGLVEEYSVSMDGVRQDFVVTEKPAGDGELKVRLAVAGARVESAAYGAQLVLEQSGRKIAYSRLHVTDANGTELPARIEVESNSETTMDVVVNDADAVYPLRIDPTFSDANWVSMGSVPGTDGTVYAEAVDGAGNLYIGGQFTVAGSVISSNIAQWNGSSWLAVGSGINSQVNALAVSSGMLYAGGNFTRAGGNAANFIAQWNGSSWLALGSGMNSQVNALAVSGGTLYAGGGFNMAGGNAVNRIAEWNGSSWSALGGGVNSIVNALAVSGTNLYAGGQFSKAGGNTANCIAQWNGSNWSPLGSGIGGGLTFSVNALAVSGGTLYAGGQFTTAGGNAANCIAQWNGSRWSPLGSGMSGSSPSVSALAVSGNTLYAVGWFATAGGNEATNIAQWNGSNWSPLGSGIGGELTLSVYALAVTGGTLYVGGDFTRAGGNAANYIAQWNGSSWSALGSGMNSQVNALVVSSGTLYAGGYFTMADGNAVNRIAQWNGSSWSALGGGVNSIVNALAVSGTNLYVGGNFTTATNDGNAAVTVNGVAQWNGSSWSPLGSGMGGGLPGVQALVVSGGTLYAGGYFMTAGGNAANYIAQWNGSTWSPLGAGMNYAVYALAVSGTNLYAGGEFTTADGNAANYIARWNGSNWSPLGSGVNSLVMALAVSGTNLYAGGWFTAAGASTANYIAQWNGSSWSPLGLGMSGPASPYVNALAVSGGTLYAGGAFTRAGGNAASCIAQWNGSSWSPLGSGLGGNAPNVNALAASGGTLYAGGTFTTAGGKVSAYAAEATIGPPTIFAQPQSTNVMAGSNANFAVGADGQPLSYQWFKNGNGLLNGGNVSGVTSNSLLLTNVYVNDPGYYLVVVSNIFGSVTSSVATLTVSNLPLVLPGGTGDLSYTSNQFWLTVAGPAGSNVVVYASTNLQTWVPLATNPLSLGSLTVTDILATNCPEQFYRAQLLP